LAGDPRLTGRPGLGDPVKAHASGAWSIAYPLIELIHAMKTFSEGR
jgi:hypothetical protein